MWAEGCWATGVGVPTVTVCLSTLGAALACSDVTFNRMYTRVKSDKAGCSRHRLTTKHRCVSAGLTGSEGYRFGRRVKRLLPVASATQTVPLPIPAVGYIYFRAVSSCSLSAIFAPSLSTLHSQLSLLLPNFQPVSPQCALRPHSVLRYCAPVKSQHKIDCRRLLRQYLQIL
jgi:hypothetical protein